MVLRQIDIPSKLDKKLVLYMARKGHRSKESAIIEILEDKLK